MQFFIQVHYSSATECESTLVAAFPEIPDSASKDHWFVLETPFPVHLSLAVSLTDCAWLRAIYTFFAFYVRQTACVAVFSW